MLRIYAQRYLEIGENIGYASALYTVSQYPEYALTDVDKKELKDYLKAMLEIAKQVELPVATALLTQSLGDIPETEREFDMLVKAINAEIKDKLFFYVPSSRAKYHENISIMPESVLAAFPMAAREMRGSGSCYAFGLFTGSVFHAMRAVEIAMRSLAIELGVTFPFAIELAQWQNVIDGITKEIKNLESLPKGSSKSENQKFYSEAAIQFTYFKDAWRNHVSHSRVIYGESEALTIHDHALQLLVSLSPKLSEASSLPLAERP